MDPSQPPPRRGYAYIAWFVILLLVTLIVGMQLLQKHQQSTGVPDPEASSSSLFLVRAQSQALFAAAQDASEQDRAMVYEQALTMLGVGSLEQRLGLVIMAYELAGQEEARSQLEHIHELQQEYLGINPSFEFTAAQRELLAVMDRIYLQPLSWDSDRTAVLPMTPVELETDEKNTLTTQLGWFGEVAITHAMPSETQLRAKVEAKASVVTGAFLGFMGIVGVLGVIGFIGLIVMSILLAIGAVKMHLRPAMPDNGIYAETFAVWLVLLFGLQMVGALLVGEEHMLEIALASFAMSLMALAWPMLRGISFSEMRSEIGWHTGRGVVVEFFAGIAGYAMTLPIAAVGLMITLLLMGVTSMFAPPPEVSDNPFMPLEFPAHPIVNSTGGLDVVKAILILLVASVAAPIVEETMFRGVLYRSMRGSTRRWPRFLSVMIGAIVVSLIFAVIHPQGLLAVPALAGLAVGMTLVREWRDSLIAPMVLHGMSNGLVMTLLLLLA